ncbi:MAG: KilA-N domain-containing protein [Bacilli bacterium]|nr:KilA-N domain-containing protein [Bacilli bacterium]
MNNELIKKELDVKGNKVSVTNVNGIEYISLTDLARYADEEEPRLPIRDWMRNKDVILYLGLWESLNNKNFKGGEFDTFKNEAGINSFKMSPQKWINSTNAIGIISKSGRYGGGTYAHPDIAFEFASWLSPEFKLYLITEFERLKKKESANQKLDWTATRLLSKANYLIHTDAIKNYIVPTITDKQKKNAYASEADILNVALFGMTAKEWRDKNPNLDGNIRDYANILELIILNNLESINSKLIEMNMSQEKRLISLNNTAKRQIELLKGNNNIKKLALLENDSKLLINNTNI